MISLNKIAFRRGWSRCLLVGALVISVCVSAWGISRVSANRRAAADSPSGLSGLLKPDGTLNLSRGFHGSLNPQGYRMEYAENGEPRFVPAVPTVGESWDTQFVNANGAHRFGRFNSCITSLTVNNTGDGTDATPGNSVCETAPGNGICTLRAAMQEANALPTCLPLTINIAVTGTINAGSILPIIGHKNLSIVGPGANLLTIDGVNKTHQMFRAGGAGVTLQISGLTITNGGVPAGNSNASAVEFNSSGGQLTLNGCALLNNVGDSQIYSTTSGGITINNSTISGNPNGTGIRIDRTPLTITNSTISKNGTGIYFPGFPSGNVTVTLLNSTVTNPIDLRSAASGSLTLKNSIIATTISLGSGISLISQGNNLCSNATLTPTAAGDLINTNPLLSALGNYGGPTPTLALLPGSPAINAGASSGAPATDQRGIARVGNVDIGAFESRGFTLTATSGSNQTAPIYTAFPNPLSLTVSSPFGEPVNGGRVTFTPPASGASCIFDNNPATISNGVVNARASANGVFGGPYNVGATPNGGNSVSFQSLTNTGPAISTVALLRTAGAGSSNSTIAQVSDPAQAANTLAVTVNGAPSATVNGVTVSGLSISAGGAVTANVAAAPGAISADFGVRVTNSQNNTATATLTVIVVSPACTGSSGTAWPQRTKLVASDGMAGSNFGYSVAISGDTAIVGARGMNITAGTNAAGAAYIFTRSGTTWTLQQKLTAEDGAAFDFFGQSVAISGDTVIVGAFGGDTTAGIDAGSAYVFTRNGTTWTQQQKLTAANGAAFDFFGQSVAISGDTVIVGADTLSSNPGSAYVFTRSGTTWTQQQKLTAADGAAGDNFGVSVAISGDTVIVGANTGDTTAGIFAGSAYVFTRSGTIWTQQQKLTAADGAADDSFGISVAISGDTVIVGAYANDTTAGDDVGSAYVFTRSGATWTQQQKLTAADGAEFDYFGNSVAISGDTVIVGASADDTTAGSFAGSAYVFTRSGATWTQQQKLTAADGAANDLFGSSVAVSGETIFVGAQADDTAGGEDAGSAYIFARNCLPSLAAQTGLLRPQGTAASNSIIATVSDTETAAGSLIVTATTVPAGLSVTNLVNTNGTIRADIATSCAAATGDNIVVLTVADGNGGTTTANLIVNVTINTAPAVVYPASVNLPANGATTVNVSTATDNGSITQYQILSVTPPLTVAPTVNAGGTVSITNAGPAGNHSITVRATDNCGANTDAGFTLIVDCPTVTINQTGLPNGFVGTGYNQSLTATGGVAPYSFTVSVGTLPGGLNLNTNGALTGTPTTQATFTFTMKATDANGCFGERQFTVIISGSGLMFYPLSSPVRLLDTRNGASPNACSQPNAPIAGETARIQPARSFCGLPANAQAITGNITTVQSGGGFLTLYPTGATRPTVAATNYGPNEIINNVFTVGLGAADGAFNIYALSTTEVVVDVTGYYAPPGAGGLYFHPLPAPVRLLETRAGLPDGCVKPGSPLPSGQDSLQTATTPCTGIPAAARAVVGNATTVSPQGNGFLTIFPADATRPLIASSNYDTNQVINGPFTTGLSASGQFKVFTIATTDLVIDLLGYYSAEAVDANGAGLLFTPLGHPVRLLETRAGQPVGCFKPAAPLNTNQTYIQPARGLCDGLTVPANALGVVGNATTVLPAGGGYLTLWPSSAVQPTVATANYNGGDIVNRHFIVGLGNADGAFKMFSSGTTELVIDLSGYFAP